MLPVLQEKGYDFYYPYAPGKYIPFLFQHGGNVYDEHAMTSALDTVEAYNAFKEYADLYIKYKIPYAANFYQRFRNGTIPIGIDGHGFFSQLMVAATELKGKWDMAQFLVTSCLTVLLSGMQADLVIAQYYKLDGIS